jgi:aspartate aminotransferase-like enzyme
MRKFLSISSGVALALLCCFSLRGLAANPAEPPAPAQDGTMPALTAIAGQGMMSNEAYEDLEELSDYIGVRVTGSTQVGQAIQWGLQKMRAMGLENVCAEKWQISRGWTRVSADAELVVPTHRRLASTIFID